MHVNALMNLLIFVVIFWYILVILVRQCIVHSLALVDIGNVSAAVLPRRNQVPRINDAINDAMFNLFNGAKLGTRCVPRMYSFSADPTARSGSRCKCVSQFGAQFHCNITCCGAWI